MKKITVRLLIAAILLLSTLGMLASCGGASTVTITLMDGDTVADTLTLSKGTVITVDEDDLNKAGYTLEGIYTDAALAEKLPEGTTADADMTLYVKYTPDTFIILVDNANGTTASTVEVTYGAPYTLPAPTREGYRFAGYKYNGAAFPLTGTYDKTIDIGIVANWTEKVYVSIYSGAQMIGDPIEVAEDGTVILPAITDDAFVGYTLGGQPFGTLQEDGTYKGTYTGTRDAVVMLKAAEPVENITVVLDPNGGIFAEGTATTITVPKGTAELRLPIPSLENKEFVAYTHGAGQTLAGTLENGELVIDLSTFTDDALILKATWRTAVTAGEVFANPDDPTTTKKYFLEVNELNDLVYVFLLGESYYYGDSTLAFPQNSGVVEAKTDPTLGNGFLAKNIGSFSIVITKSTGETTTALAKVVHRVDTTQPGTATAGRNEDNFRQGLVTELLAGISNLRPDINVGTGSGLLTIDKIPYVITVTDQDGNPVTAYTIDVNGAINFDEGVIGGAAPATKLTITVRPKYALAMNAAACTEIITVIPNNGVNVYTSNELYDAYANLNVHTINLMRNIIAEVHPNHSFEGNGVNLLNEWYHGVYVRKPTAIDDTIVLNGNCYTVDASRIAPLDIDKGGLADYNVGNPYSADNTYRLVNQQSGIFTYYGYDLSLTTDYINSQTVPTMTVNDLFLHGNFNGNGDATSGSTATGVKPLLAGGLSLLGFEARHTALNLTNVRIDYTHTAVYTNGYEALIGDQPGNPTKLHAKVALDGVTIDKNFINAFYCWGQTGIDVKDSYIGQSSGAIFQFDDSPTLATNAYSSYLNIGEDVTLNNLVTGSEAWFVAYSLTPAVGQLKVGINQAIDGYFGGVGKITCDENRVPASDTTGTTYMNFILVARADGFGDLAGNVTNEQGSLITGSAPTPFVPIYKGEITNTQSSFMGVARGDMSTVAGINGFYHTGIQSPAGDVSMFVEVFMH